jgi:hypothetical protein
MRIGDTVYFLNPDGSLSGSQSDGGQFTPTAPSTLASPGGMMRRLGHAVYESMPEITAGTAGLLGGLAPETGAPFWAPPLVGGVTAAVQRAIEGSSPWDTAKSAGLHTALNAAPLASRIPAVSRGLQSGVDAVSAAGAALKRVPGVNELLSLFKGALPEAAGDTIDVDAEIARAGSFHKTADEVQLQAWKKWLENNPNPQSRGMALDKIAEIMKRMAAAKAAQTGSRAATAFQTGLPLSEMIAHALYPEGREP